MTTIQLDSMVFSDFATSGWVFEELVGWRGQTNNKQPNNERPQSHGSYGTIKALRSSRPISFKATYLGSSDAEVGDAVDELCAIGAELPIVIQVTDGQGISFRTVTVENIDVPDNNQASEGIVNVDLLARDPRRYADGPWVTTAPPDAGTGLVWPVIWPAVWPAVGGDGRLRLTNSGRAPSSPTIRLNGGFTSATVTCAETGSRVSLNRFVDSGDQVVIDYKARTAILNGQSDLSRFLELREWETVPGRTSRSFQFDVIGATGSPTMDGRVLSAWW